MKSLKSFAVLHKKMVLFFSVLFMIGFATGIFLGVSHLEEIKPYVFSFASSSIHVPNLLFVHLGMLCVGFLFSCILIGIPFLFCIFFYEALSFGFLFSLMSILFFLKGSVYAILYFLIFKAFFVLVLFVFSIKCIKIPEILFKLKNGDSNRLQEVKRLCLSCVILFTLQFVYDSFLFLFGNHFLSLFSFLLFLSKL